MADSNLASVPSPDPNLPRPNFKFTEFQLRKFRRAFYLKGKLVDASFLLLGEFLCQKVCVSILSKTRMWGIKQTAKMDPFF